MDDIRIERFDASLHVRAAFDCGNSVLNDFLRRLVTQYEKRGLGRTHVAVRRDEPNLVLAYYTLAAGSLPVDELSAEIARKLPRHPVPTILLGRLAVDLSVQRKGLGARLIVDAGGKALDISHVAGANAMEVLATDRQAAVFYAKFGFRPLLDDPQHMFLPMTSVQEAIERAKRSER